MREKVLVTGGGGFLGHALKQVLPDAVYLTRQDGDLRDHDAARRIFEEHRPERVIHLAAEVGGVKINARKNSEFFESNVLINLNVLNAAKEFGVNRLISMLSACSFRFYPGRPTTEEDLHDGLPYEGNLGYGYAKRMLDVETRLLWKEYGCQFSTFTPVTMYGPGDNWDLEDGHVTASLIHKCFLAKQQNKSLEIWGTGKAVRQFVFSLDVARLLVKALDSFEGPETVLIAPDEGTTIKELTQKIAGAMNFQGPLVFNPAQPEGEPVRRVKSLRFKGLYPDFRFTPLDKGLKETVEWFSVFGYHNLFKQKRSVPILNLKRPL